MFRGEPYESVSPLVKAILAVTSGGERYRLGHYGAITKVPGGNVAGKGMLLSARAASHIDEERKAQPFPIPLFSGSTATGVWLAGGVRVGSGVSQVMGAFWATLERHRRRETAPSLAKKHLCCNATEAVH